MANNNWNNYTEKNAALTDKDEIMLRDSTDGKNKRSPLSKIWNYMVDKMATAVISKLETDNKTIIGAINYLYGKTSKTTKISDNVSKNENVSEAMVYKTSIGKLLILHFKFTVTTDIPARSQVILNIPASAPAINSISATFVRTNDLANTIFYIDNYPYGGISLVNTEKVIPGNYRGAVSVITI